MITTLLLVSIIGAAYCLVTYETGRSVLVRSIPYQLVFGSCQQVCLAKPRIDQNQQGPSNVNSSSSRQCPCDGCACQTIRKFYKLVSPITEVYSEVTKYPEKGLNILAPAQLCANDCKRRAKFVFGDNRGPLGNFTFASETEDEIIKSKNKELMGKISSVFTKKDKDGDVNTKPAAITAQVQLAINDDKKTIHQIQEKSLQLRDRSSTTSNCSRCSENNKTCLKNCPRAQKK